MWHHLDILLVTTNKIRDIIDILFRLIVNIAVFRSTVKGGGVENREYNYSLEHPATSPSLCVSLVTLTHRIPVAATGERERYTRAVKMKYSLFGLLKPKLIPLLELLFWNERYLWHFFNLMTLQDVRCHYEKKVMYEGFAEACDKLMKLMLNLFFNLNYTAVLI